MKNITMVNIESFNTIEEVELYRKQINEACDSRADFIGLCSKANRMSEGSFGLIKESFEAISPMLFNSDAGKKIMNKYAKTIRESKNLSSLHTLYENIRKADKESDVDFFINSLVNEEWNVNGKTVADDCKKLGRILAEGYLLLGHEADEAIAKENPSLSKAVQYIAENKKTAKNIVDYSNAIKIIRESVNNNEPHGNMFESVDLDKLASSLLEEFNKKYSDTLSEEEAVALKEISSSSDREAVFAKYKASCTEKISEAKALYQKRGDSASVERLSTVMEQVSNKKYSLDTLGSDICSLIELSNIFE